MAGHNGRLYSQQRIELRPDVQEIVAALVENIMALAALASHSNRDSNSLGGILIYCPEKWQEMPEKGEEANGTRSKRQGGYRDWWCQGNRWRHR